MPIVDGWMNVFRLSAADPVPSPDADMRVVGALFGGSGPDTWVTHTVGDAVEAMDQTGTDRGLLTVRALPADGPGGSANLLSVEDGLAACRMADERFRLVLHLQDVDSPRGNACLVREHAALDEVVALGVFPAYLEADLHDRRLYPVYEACIEHGLPVRLNLGIAGPMVPSRHQHPELLEDLLIDFPELTVIGCHMGHPYEALLVRLMMKFPRLYLMTSGYLPKYFDPALVQFMGSSRGIGRVMFGSDHPGIPLYRALEEARKLPIREDALDQFLGTALCDVLGWA
jgi:predicted TIM-barrel fold metal-dependent hydrolase